MKKIINYISIISLIAILSSCTEDFDKINTDPNATGIESVNLMWMLNKSITDAQMDPHIGERIFVYYWMDAARMHRFGKLSTGYNNDGYNNDYVNRYLSSWMRSAQKLIILANERIIKNNFTTAHEADMAKNIREVARIWYSYLISEYTDNYGPAPIDAFTGKTPTYSSVKDVYYFMLEELKDAQSKIDITIKPNDAEKKYDRAYNFDFSKWVKYANSMRMRLAMRLSEIDPQKAKAEFEEASKAKFISEKEDIFRVKEQAGWNALSAVMGRGWNNFAMSSTLANLMVGLGSVKSKDCLTDPKYTKYIKEKDYLGKQFTQHWPEYTNNPYAGFFMDGIPYSIDPRFFTLYSLPLDAGHRDNPDKTKNDKGKTIDNPNYYFKLLKVGEKVAEGKNPTKIDSINVTFAVNGLSTGNWGNRGAANDVNKADNKSTPILQKKYRDSNNYRVFFGDWESYFLIAEASLRGWTVSTDAKTAYNKGIEASFVYNDIDQSKLSTYLASEDYNRVGTSVKWEHTTEPPASVEMKIINGYTKASENFNYKYPVASQTLYGKALNDKLSKIITQKYLAQVPWLPLEAWNDHRRLGLPFFDNITVETPLTRMSWLTQSNVKNSQAYNFFPQRIKYPSSFENSNPKGYQQALELLGGKNSVFTPLWWAKQQ